MIRKFQKIEENERKLNEIIDMLEIQNAVLDKRLSYIEEKIFDEKEREMIEKALKQMEKRKLLEKKAKKILLDPIKAEILEDRDLVKAVVSEIKKELTKNN
ncbi:MAG: hypothetical protein DRO96_00240 [Candidatus Aenigmatarchaeota archaeon]|nr:MAG: hypothetical protein B6U68_01765 [Candidatus Aenigmarchaeota archaeon ex4484_14]RLF35834.1 MAG: hypothetical protein DRN08_02390 [Thermoplasmata archaeon]RLI97564.1 MAG: hypothetical protein DRO96_00240 [Candidatus Aenigmarchaeota archaeon]